MAKQETKWPMVTLIQKVKFEMKIILFFFLIDKYCPLDPYFENGAAISFSNDKSKSNDRSNDHL